MRLRGLTYDELVILGNLGDRLADSELVKRANEGAQIRTGTCTRIGQSSHLTGLMGSYAHGDADAVDELLTMGAPLPGYEYDGVER
jgi:hypothetical protein